MSSSPPPPVLLGPGFPARLGRHPSGDPSGRRDGMARVTRGIWERVQRDSPDRVSWVTN